MRRRRTPSRSPEDGVRYAKEHGQDVVIIDTAGRLHIDEEMMKQVADIAKAVKPHQIYLVCDAMTGQDAVNSAKEFNERLELDGVILTKLDCDARGGAALSVKAVTGKPIKFIGVGEKLDKLEEFHPDRMAGRILGMGDVVTLVEKAQEQFDAEEAQKLQEKMAKGSFGFDDFLKQMQAMKKMGGMKDMLKLMPGMGGQMADLDLDGQELGQMEAIVHSMTPDERRDPDLIDARGGGASRPGCGAEVNDVSSLVKTFKRSRDMMKALSGGSIGGLKALFSRGFNMEAMNAAMTHGRKIKQRSKRKRVIKRHGKNQENRMGSARLDSGNGNAGRVQEDRRLEAKVKISIHEYLEEVARFCDNQYGNRVRSQFEDVQGTSELAMLVAPTSEELSAASPGGRDHDAQ